MTSSSCQSCVDVCTDVCLSGHVARGSIRTTERTACLASDERLATFRFDLTVNNCSERTINNFMPRLDLNNVFLAEGGAVCSPSRVTSALRVTASIGEANGLYDGTERTALLCHTVPLPPGCSTFSVYLTDPHLNAAALQRALFSVKGHVKCAPCALDACEKPLAPQCVALHKSVALNCDCLPLETEPSARRIVYVRPEPTLCVDINCPMQGTFTQPGFAPLPGTLDSSVAVGNVVFSLPSASNSPALACRTRNFMMDALTRDFTFSPDVMSAMAVVPVRLQIDNLPAGTWRVAMWAFDATNAILNQQFGYRQLPSGADVDTVVGPPSPSAATPSAEFDLVSDGTSSYELFVRALQAGVGGNFRTRLNGVKLTPIGGEGASWTTAYRGALGLQQAVANAVAGEQVWVAEGTYTLTSGNLQVPSGVKVFGGFHAGDTALCQRTLHVEGGSTSVITTQGSSASFPNDLITMTLVDARTVFDGFTISGIVDTDPDSRDLLLVNGGAPRIRNLAVRDNIYAGGFQWQMRDSSLDAVICNCLWDNNNNDFVCAGITQFFAGGVGRSTLVNCTFRRNLSAGGQGAALCLQDDGGNLTAINCVFEGNVSTTGIVTVFSPLLSTQQQTATLQSCTFIGNVSSSVRANVTGSGPARANVLNSIIVSNAPATNFSTFGTGLITVQQSILSDATPFSNVQIEDLGGNKVGVSRAQAFGGDGSTAPRLAPGAVAINCGTNAPLVVGTDRANRPRVAKGRVDVGAFELNC